MNESVMREVLRSSQRARPFEQGWTAHREKSVPQQEGGFEARPATTTVTDADVHSLRGEVNQSAAGVDAQVV